jgi:hypothetical protein
MFGNKSLTTQLTIPANTTQTTLSFQAGTLPGTIQLALTLSADGVDITPAAQPTATTTIAASAPTISSIAVSTSTGGFTVTVTGTSTTLSMSSVVFQFNPAAGANLQTTSITLSNVPTLFSNWYGSAASLKTGSQFELTVPFTVTGNISSIASVTVTLTNSAGSTSGTANVP